MESVKDLAEIIILDGNSIDKTLEIAQRYGCRIYKQYDTDEPNVAIKDYSEVRNKGLRLASHDWFMFIDSDEYLSPEAVADIRSITTSPAPRVYAFWQPRKYVLDGKVVDCAMTYPNQQIRLFHRGWVKSFIKPVHERIELKEGVQVGIINGFEYVPLESLEHLKARWERYIPLERKIYEGAHTKKLLRLIKHQTRTLVSYTIRFLRNLFFCRGYRLPWSYEWLRIKFEIRLLSLIVKELF